MRSLQPGIRAHRNAPRGRHTRERPGGFRNLEAAIRQRSAEASGVDLGIELEAHGAVLGVLLEERSAPGVTAGDGTLQDALDAAATARIRGALAAAGGERMAAARALGVDRTTLYRLMRRLGL